MTFLLTGGNPWIPNSEVKTGVSCLSTNARVTRSPVMLESFEILSLIIYRSSIVNDALDYHAHILVFFHKNLVIWQYFGYKA